MAILTDAHQLNWAAAREAAQRIIKRCDDVWFTPPEALGAIHAQLQAVADDMTIIATALLLLPPADGEAK